MKKIKAVITKIINWFRDVKNLKMLREAAQEAVNQVTELLELRQAIQDLAEEKVELENTIEELNEKIKELLDKNKDE